jgi:hypothetical protein
MYWIRTLRVLFEEQRKAGKLKGPGVKTLEAALQSADEAAEQGLKEV